MAEGAEGIRWGRALLAAVLVEVLLGIVATPVTLLSSTPVSTLNLLVPPLSFVVAMLVVAWLFSRAERPVANGVATGLMGVLLYVVLALLAWQLAPERMNPSDALAAPNIAAYLLKIAGCIAGGWWAGRQRTVAGG